MQLFSYYLHLLLSQDMSKYYVCSQIYICLCDPCHVYAQTYILMWSVPCLCVQTYMLDAMLCASIAFSSLDMSLSCILALQVGCRSRSCGLSQHPYTQAYIKGFGLFHLCMCLLAWFYAFYHVCLPRSRFCHTWFPLWACACVVASVPLVACLGVTTCENTSS